METTSCGQDMTFEGKLKEEAKGTSRCNSGPPGRGHMHTHRDRTRAILRSWDVAPTLSGWHLCVACQGEGSDTGCPPGGRPWAVWPPAPNTTWAPAGDDPTPPTWSTAETELQSSNENHTTEKRAQDRCFPEGKAPVPMSTGTGQLRSAMKHQPTPISPAETKNSGNPSHRDRQRGLKLGNHSVA